MCFGMYMVWWFWLLLTCGFGAGKFWWGEGGVMFPCKKNLQVQTHLFLRLHDWNAKLYHMMMVIISTNDWFQTQKWCSLAVLLFLSLRKDAGAVILWIELNYLEKELNYELTSAGCCHFLLLEKQLVWHGQLTHIIIFCCEPFDLFWRTEEGASTGRYTTKLTRAIGRHECTGQPWKCVRGSWGLLLWQSTIRRINSLTRGYLFQCQYLEYCR